MYGRTHTWTWYNPLTNHISSREREGYECMGCKKIAEAFTSVSPKERILLYKSLQGSTHSFDFSMLNSKIRHKLKRLGLYQLGKRIGSEGEYLLEKINKKK